MVGEDRPPQHCLSRVQEFPPVAESSSRRGRRVLVHVRGAHLIHHLLYHHDSARNLTRYAPECEAQKIALQRLFEHCTYDSRWSCQYVIKRLAECRSSRSVNNHRFLTDLPFTETKGISKTVSRRTLRMRSHSNPICNNGLEEKRLERKSLKTSVEIS